MSIEIERKFLLKSDDWRLLKHTHKHYKQAYFCNTNKVSIRVRIADDSAWIGFKSATRDITRFEYEYQVPIAEAEHMMEQFSQGAIISKVRYFVPFEQHLWEIDVFEGDNQGLVVAEIELNNEDETFIKPCWIGEEVSQDGRYYNSNLVSFPFKDW